MDIRVLKYFLVVSETLNLTKAAEILMTTQPNLSRQLQNLESEIGLKLFTRDQKRLALTEEGVFFKQKASEIVELFDKDEAEIKNYNKGQELKGDIYFAVAESLAFQVVARSLGKLIADHPKIKFHIKSYAIEETLYKLDNGFIDFGLVLEPAPIEKYNAIQLPTKHTWGLIFHKDFPLAQNDVITSKDLKGIPLITSRSSLNASHPLIAQGFADKTDLKIVGTYNLINNGLLLTKEKIGYLIGIDNVIEHLDEDLVFKPFFPHIESKTYLIYRKFNNLNKCCFTFLDYLQKELDNEEQ